MAKHLDLQRFLDSFDGFEEELKPIDAWGTLLSTLEGLPVANDLQLLTGSPLHQWLEEVANAIDPLDLVETLDRELRRRVGLAAAISLPSDELVISLCKSLEILAWTRGRDARSH
ncbi:MAG: hypothetical protein PVH06_06845 [Methyloceanibacter sp.]|jgi:hypothetical protein